MAKVYRNGVLSNYTIKPRNLTQYNAFRGVVDYTQIGQFAQFESGYSFLSVIQMPRFMVVLGEQDDDVKSLTESFQHMLEYEFRGMDGLPDITSETYTISDGINEQNLINRVTMDTSIQVSSTYYEKTGGLISKFTELYLTGIKDRMTQAKTYHGLIRDGILEPGPENEVFTMLYYVTDNTMLNLERAVLLCNCQLTTSRLSDILNSSRGDISNRETTIEWNCFPVMGRQVDKAAKALLQDITGVEVKPSEESGKIMKYNSFRESGVAYTDKRGKTENTAFLDSKNYKYGVMDENSPSAKIEALVQAIGTDEEAIEPF